MQGLKLCNLSKCSFIENVDVINAFDAKGLNEVQIELDSYFLIFILVEYFGLPQMTLHDVCLHVYRNFGTSQIQSFCPNLILFCRVAHTLKNNLTFLLAYLF